MALRDAPNLNQLWSRLLVEELVRGGVCGFVLSPGSRCAPLSVAVAEHPKARRVVHFDERGAAFHALGWAQATGKPAVLVCTSGSACANYWPAVVEASASLTPLILLTADRPPELLHCGANQAIDQPGIYGNYTRWRCTLPCPDVAIPPAMVLSTVDQALYRATTPPGGPVHVDCMFREPLAPDPDGVDCAQLAAGLEAWEQSEAPYTTYHAPVHWPGLTFHDSLLKELQKTKRGLIVAGGMTLPECAAVFRISEALKWPVLPDVCSGLRTKAIKGDYLHYYDQMLLSTAFQEQLTPDVVLHLGGPFTSKRLALHLARVACSRGKAFRYVHVAEHPLRQDPHHLVTDRIQAPLLLFWPALLGKSRGTRKKGWADHLVAASREAGDALTEWETRQPGLSEITVARLISQIRPSGSLVFLGNSMPVRDMDFFADAEGPEGAMRANRGASGIDGNIATAAGHAAAGKRPVTLVLGDLAVLHDLNSLALLRNVEAPVVLVILNNDGGGIFSFLPIARHAAVFEPYFGTPHGLTFENAAHFFGLDYLHTETRAAFATGYKKALARKGCTIIEVRSNRDKNKALHEELGTRLRDVTEAALSGKR